MQGNDSFSSQIELKYMTVVDITTASVQCIKPTGHSTGRKLISD